MASIVVSCDVDIVSSRLEELFEHCCEHMPSYALPRFIRFQKAIQLTETLKQKKIDLRKDGYDPDKCKPDDLYYLDLAHRKYNLLTHEAVKCVENGEIRM